MIDIEPSSWRYHPLCDKDTLFAKKSLPLVKSYRGFYTHRVRHVTIYPKGTHMVASCWCGMSISISRRKPSRLLSEMPIDSVMCAVCEGKAIGAGCDGDTTINGRESKYQPRQHK